MKALAFSAAVVLVLSNLVSYRSGRLQERSQRRPPMVFLIVNPARHPFGSPLSPMAYRYSEKQNRINIWRYQVCGSEPIGVGDIPLQGR